VLLLFRSADHLSRNRKHWVSFVLTSFPASGTIYLYFVQFRKSVRVPNSVLFKYCFKVSVQVPVPVPVYRLVGLLSLTSSCFRFGSAVYLGKTISVSFALKH
jgi:hypothetical protein